MSGRLFVLGLCALASCSHANVATDPHAAKAGEKVVTMLVKTASQDSEGWQPVAPGSVLASGTQFAVEVRVPERSVVYVAQRNDKGDAEVIYPAEQQPLRLDAGAVASLPGAGLWFTLDQSSGKEWLFLLASTGDHDREAARRLVRERGEAACVSTRDPPPPEVKVRDRRQETIRQKMGTDGLAVLCFPFHHQ